MNELRPKMQLITLRFQQKRLRNQMVFEDFELSMMTETQKQEIMERGRRTQVESLEAFFYQRFQKTHRFDFAKEVQKEVTLAPPKFFDWLFRKRKTMVVSAMLTGSIDVDVSEVLKNPPEFQSPIIEMLEWPDAKRMGNWTGESVVEKPIV